MLAAPGEATNSSRGAGLCGSVKVGIKRGREVPALKLLAKRTRVTKRGKPTEGLISSSLPLCRRRLPERKRRQRCGRYLGMPGRPKLRALLAGIESVGGLPEILDRIASGRTMASIARDIGSTPNMLGDWLNDDPARRADYLRARGASALALAEQALEISDGSSIEGVQVSRLQVDTRKWLASKYDAATYGDKHTGVQINIGQLHLDALRKVQADMQPVIDVSHTESTT